MDAFKLLKANKEIIIKKFCIKKIGLFGSFAKGNDRPDSDVDVLVEFEKPVDIFEFLDVKEFLEGLFGRKVDLVTKKALKPLLTERIFKGVLYA